MSQTERDLTGIEARQSREIDAEIVADDDETPVDGVVRHQLRSEDITSPIDLYRREPNARELAVIEELCEVGDMNPDSPATIADFVKLVSRVNELKLEERENNRNQSDRLIEAMGKRTPAAVLEDFEKQFKAMRWKVNVMWAILVVVLTAAGGSTIAVAKWLRESGRTEFQDKMLIDHDADHEKRIRDMEELSKRNSSRIDDHLSGHRGGGAHRDLTPGPPASKLTAP